MRRVKVKGGYQVSRSDLQNQEQWRELSDLNVLASRHCPPRILKTHGEAIEDKYISQSQKVSLYLHACPYPPDS